MNQRAAERMYSKLHDGEGMPEWHDGTFDNWSPQWSPMFPFRFDDGVSVFVSTVDLNPDDHFLTPPARPESEAGDEHGSPS